MVEEEEVVGPGCEEGWRDRGGYLVLSGCGRLPCVGSYCHEDGGGTLRLLDSDFAAAAAAAAAAEGFAGDGGGGTGPPLSFIGP